MIRRPTRKAKPWLEPPPKPDMVWVGGSGGMWINDPRKPIEHPEMVCLRCHSVGMTTFPGGNGQAVCHASVQVATDAAGNDVITLECPKPWHCRACKVGDVSHHAKWCDGEAGWCAPGACSICDEMRTEAA